MIELTQVPEENPLTQVPEENPLTELSAMLNKDLQRWEFSIPDVVNQ